MSTLAVSDLPPVNPKTLRRSLCVVPLSTLLLGLAVIFATYIAAMIFKILGLEGETLNGLFGLLSLIALTCIAASLIGALPFLLLGEWTLKKYLKRRPARPVAIAFGAFLTNTGICLTGIGFSVFLLNGTAPALLLVLLYAGSFFAPIWGFAFACHYRAAQHKHHP